MKDKPWSEMTEGEALAEIGAKASSRDGKMGLEIAGMFIPALDKDECPEAIIASPPGPYAVKGSTEATCSDCGNPVIIAPNSQEIVSRCPETLVICLNCFARREGIEDPGR